MQKKLLFLILGFSALIALFHFFGNLYFWYWSLWWFDIPMHVAGGTLISLLVAWIQGERNRSLHPAFIIGVAFAIGIAWEFFEASIGLTRDPGYAFDTLHDLADDLCGNMFGYLIAIRFSGRAFTFIPTMA